MRWDLVADHSTRCVDLSHNLTLCAARKYVLLRTLFCQVPSDLSSVRKHDKYVDIVLKCNLCCCCTKHVSDVTLTSLSDLYLSEILICLLVVVNYFSFCD